MSNIDIILSLPSITNVITTIKGLVAELAPPHAQNAWGSRGERVRTAELAACCNYFSKKEKKKRFNITSYNHRDQHVYHTTVIVIVTIVTAKHHQLVDNTITIVTNLYCYCGH